MEMEESNEEMFVDGKGCRISVEIRMNNSLIGSLVFFDIDNFVRR